MLVLTRQPAERILIGDDIVIEIREVRGSQIKIGIEAPPWVKVLREELVERRDRTQAGRSDAVCTTTLTPARGASPVWHP